LQCGVSDHDGFLRHDLQMSHPCMKKKELRLALVCCGGLSLVLYMQGVIKEFLKLTRAYHSIDDPERRQVETFARTAGNDGRERDTEAIYFSLLQAVGRDLDLRIIVDSVAGASAGGISGIILARALAHDLSIDHLRGRWLEETDVLRLLAKSQRARAWSKWFLSFLARAWRPGLCCPQRPGRRDVGKWETTPAGRLKASAGRCDAEPYPKMSQTTARAGFAGRQPDASQNGGASIQKF
jgi:hypothetical protein